MIDYNTLPTILEKNYEILEHKIVLFAEKFYFRVDKKLKRELAFEFHKIIINFEFIKNFNTKNVIPLSFPCDDFFVISFNEVIKKNEPDFDFQISKKLVANFSKKDENNYLVIEDING